MSTSMSRNNPPNRDNFASDSAYQYAVRQYNERYPVPEKGALNWNQTKRWDGSKWNDVNIIHRGQRAKLNDEAVYADGKGNWRSLATLDVMGTRQSEGNIVGTYGDKPQPRSAFADLRGSITPGSMQPAATNLGEGAAFDAAERFRTGKGYPAGVSRPSDYPVQFNPENAIPPVPELSLSDQLQQERATLGLTPMQQWAMANKGLAQKVADNQSGYDEIQAYFEAQDTERTPMDQLAINRGGVETVIDGKGVTSTPLAGRDTAAPTGAFAQYGTQMSGSSNPFASIALPGTTQGLSQLFLTPGQMKMPDSSSYINVDAFDGAGNFGADKLDLDRFLPFLGIDTDQELNRITNITRRKK